MPDIAGGDVGRAEIRGQRTEDKERIEQNRQEAENVRISGEKNNFGNLWKKVRIGALYP